MDTTSRANGSARMAESTVEDYFRRHLARRARDYQRLAPAGTTASGGTPAPATTPAPARTEGAPASVTPEFQSAPARAALERGA